LDPESIVRRLLDAWAMRDVDTVASFYAPDAEIVGGPFFGERRTYRGGPNALRQALERVEQEFEDYEATPRAIRPGGSAECVLVEGLVSARSRGAAGRSAWRSWWVFVVRGGKIQRFEAFHEERSALLAAGLLTGG
jgi:ketosteroid isomerase-like protein